MTSPRIQSPHIAATALLLTALLVLRPPPAAAMGGQDIIGSGVVSSETRDASGFRGVALAIEAKLELHQDGTEGLSVTGDDNVVPLVETVVEDGTLRVRWKKGNYSARYNDLAIVVHAKSIDSLAIAGSGEITAKALKTGKLRMSLAGSGRAAVDSLNADSANISIEGSGRVTAAGRIDSLDVSVAGSGALAAAKLESQKAKVAVAGSGRAILWATQALDASVLGSGTVRYYGKPRVHSAVAGSGTIRQMGEQPG
jgi:hypothetical protein